MSALHVDFAIWKVALASVLFVAVLYVAPLMYVVLMVLMVPAWIFTYRKRDSTPNLRPAVERLGRMRRFKRAMARLAELNAQADALDEIEDPGEVQRLRGEISEIGEAVASVVRFHDTIDQRVNMFVATLLAGLAFITLLRAPMWLPAETIVLDDGTDLVGYVVPAHDSWWHIIIDDDRTVTTVHSASVSSRQVCTARHDLPSWAHMPLAEMGASPTHPPCADP